MADERVDEFDKWSKGRGLVARDVDRKRVAKELLEIAEGGPVEPEHVEELIRRYRNGLVGAHGILNARRVGEEMLTWQKESRSSRSAEPRPGSERPASGRPFAEEFSLSSAPPKRASSSPGGSLPPGMRTVPPAPRAPHIESPAASPFPSVRPVRGAPRDIDELDLDIGGPSASNAPPKIRRERVEPEDIGGGWLEAEDSFDDDEPPRVSARPTTGTRSPEAATRLSERARPASSRPPDRGSDRPAARLSGRPATDRAPKSLTPLGTDAFDLDDEPKKYKAGRDKAPSMRPAGAQAVPDVDVDDKGVDPERRRRNDDLTDSIAPPPPAAPQIALPGPPLGELVEDRPITWDASKRLIGYILVGVFTLGIAVLVLTRPGCWLAPAGKDVQGTFVSEHLGISMEFSEPWKHATSLDDDEEKGSWERRVSIFYRGADSHNDAPSQLYVIVFSSSKAIATEADARQLGANEVMNAAQRRRCEPIDIDDSVGTQCFALSARPGRQFGVVETYWPVDGKAVFVRALIELPIMQQSQHQDPAEADNFEREIMRNIGAVEDIMYSIKSLPRK